MRSALFVPGDNTRMIEKALATEADAVIFDLEDAVPEDRKDRARAGVGEVLAAARSEHSRSRPAIIVRINSFESPRWRDDLATAMRAPPDAIMLPKPRSGADVARLSAEMDRLEATHVRAGSPGDAQHPTGIVAIATERAASVLALTSYAGASPRLSALAWGTEDLSTEIGAVSAHDADGRLASPYRLARDLCLLAATAARVDAIDQVHVALGDPAGLEREARAAARDGFTGKMAIHPDQVAIINAAFTPRAEDVTAACALVAAFAAQGGNGAFAHDGRMVDVPHRVRAERLIARAQAAARRK